MAGATFSRIKNWIAEELTSADLNAEIDNILTNLKPAGMDSYSINLAQMQLQTDPGLLGSESLATSLAGEIERLRYVIQRIIGGGTSYWYESPANTIAELTAALGTGLPRNRISSGATSANSSQMLALDPDGSAATVTLLGAATDFVYYINGTQYTIDSDVALTGLSTAPSTNNTCAVNDALADDGQDTEAFGQYGTEIIVDAMGTEISSLVGGFAAFKKGAEYFVAYVKSSTKLTSAFRGCFFNSSLTALPAETLLDNDTITLMKLSWLFATTTGTVAVTYNTPTVAAVAPSTPAIGDYWFDLVNDTWKTYNSTTWVSANATLIGWSVQDTTNCVAARTFDQFVAVSDVNNLQVEVNSTATLKATQANGVISIFGNDITFKHTHPSWSMATDLESGYSEASSTNYFAYMTPTGLPKLSPVNPQYRSELLGFYHPTETWRCVGWTANDGSSDFTGNGHTLRDRIDLPMYSGGVWLSAADTGTFTTISASYAAVTNLEVTVRSTGRPIKLQLVPNEASGEVWINSTSETMSAQLKPTVSYNGGSATDLPALTLTLIAGLAGISIIKLGMPSSSFSWLYQGADGLLPEGTYAFTVEVIGLTGSPGLLIDNVKLLAYEI